MAGGWGPLPGGAACRHIPGGGLLGDLQVWGPGREMHTRSLGSSGSRPGGAEARMCRSRDSARVVANRSQSQHLKMGICDLESSVWGTHSPCSSGPVLAEVAWSALVPATAVHPDRLVLCPPATHRGATGDSENVSAPPPRPPCDRPGRLSPRPLLLSQHAAPVSHRCC